MANSSQQYGPEAYESGELPVYAQVARSYPTDKTGKIIADSNRIARIQATMKQEQQMKKAGARHSAGDRALIQKVHDDAVNLGAQCSEMGKSIEASEHEVKFAKQHDLSVLKVDEELGLVFGWAIISKNQGEEYFDVQGDHIPEQSMLKASTDFMLSDRVGKEMHAGGTKGTIVFAWPLTTDIAKAMGLETDRTGLMIAWKPHDVATLEKFKSGEFSGFSIGGSRHEDEEVGD